MDRDHGVYHVTKANKQALVFVPPKTTDACIIMEIGRAAARVWGTFAGIKAKQKAYLLNPGCKDCSPAIVAIRDGNKRILGARRMENSCSMGGKVTARTVFSKKHQTLEVRCRAGQGGNDYAETASLMQLTKKGLILLLTVPVGMGLMWPDSDSGKMCQTWAAGWIKVTKKGSQPKLKTLEMIDQMGWGTDNAWHGTYVYDASGKKFQLTRKQESKTVKVKPKCKKVNLKP